MANYTFGTRVHDLGKGSPAKMFGKAQDVGFDCVQLAYKKGITGVNSYADVTDALVAETQSAIQASGVQVGVLGTYVELAMADQAQRKQAVTDFISQLPVCKALGAGCIGTETTNMVNQPAGTTREQGLQCLLRSLDEILPKAEELGVLVAVEPVFYHSMNTPEATKMVLDSIASPNLRVIFDAVNLLTAEDQTVAGQERMWDRMMDLVGDKIAACHIKGVRFDEKGDFHGTSFAESCLDYPLLARYIRQLPQDLPLLREEQKPELIATELPMLRHWFNA